MTWLAASDPQALLALQSGVVGTPTSQASGSSDLLSANQRAAALGEPIPVVFARYRDGAGGVLLRPPATEVRFENDFRNRVTASYHLVLGEGPMDYVQVRDVFSGSTRAGTFNQTYNRRAGTWLPGNYIINVNVVARWFVYDPEINAQMEIKPVSMYNWQNNTLPALKPINLAEMNWYPVTYGIDSNGRYYESYLIDGTPVKPTLVFTNYPNWKIPQLSQYCGTVGNYPGLSTLSYVVQGKPFEDDSYQRQVNIFIRGGLNVTRLVDGVTGPSDNWADLVRWLMQRTARLPDALIDTTALTQAALFLDRQGFTCNTVLSEVSSLADYVARVGPYFLLAESRVNGRLGLRPVVPTSADGSITAVVEPTYVFTEDDLLPGSFEVNYATRASRQPFVVQVIWRQQLVNELGFNRTLEMRYDGTAQTGPYESHDCSSFITSELHAARVAAFILSRRARVTHTARWTARPGLHNIALMPGSIVRLILPRDSSIDAGMDWDYLYQIERVTKTLAGDIAYEASHVPVDADGLSLVVQDVLAATATGIVVPPQRTGPTVDTNSNNDATVPPDVGIPPIPEQDLAPEQKLPPLEDQKPPQDQPTLEDTGEGVIKATGTAVPKCAKGSNAVKNYRWYPRTESFSPDQPFFQLTEQDIGGNLRMAIYYTCPYGDYPPNPERATVDTTFQPGDLMPNGEIAATLQTYKAGEAFPWGVVQAPPVRVSAANAPPVGTIMTFKARAMVNGSPGNYFPTSYRKPHEIDVAGEGGTVFYYNLAGERTYTGFQGPSLRIDPMKIGYSNPDGSGYVETVDLDVLKE